VNHSRKVTISTGTLSLFLEAEKFKLWLDNVDCNSYTSKCENIQYARVKFDKSQPQLVVFDVDVNKNTIMRLTGRGTYDGDDMVNAMKAGYTMYLEITPYNSKGQKQIVEFSLIGFTAAINQCN